MMDMMNTTGFVFGFAFLWGIHILSVIAFFTGIALFIALAAKTFSQQQLKSWTIGLLVAGIIACLFTIGVRGAPWTDSGMMGKKSGMMRIHMMEKIMMGRDSDDAMGMSMDDMSAMLEGKTGDAFDAAFIAGMIPHHQGAIDMANAALKDAKHEEIKRMARAIVTAQQKEIDQMKAWQSAWGYGQ